MKEDFDADPDHSLDSVGDKVRGCCDGWAACDEDPMLVTRVVTVVTAELPVF